MHKQDLSPRFFVVKQFIGVNTRFFTSPLDVSSSMGHGSGLSPTHNVKLSINATWNLLSTYHDGDLESRSCELVCLHPMIVIDIETNFVCPGCPWLY